MAVGVLNRNLQTNNEMVAWADIFYILLYPSIFRILKIVLSVS